MKTISLGNGFTVSGNSIELKQSGFTVEIKTGSKKTVTKNFSEQWLAREWMKKIKKRYTFVEVK